MKNYFKGLIIGGGGALLAGYGIALVLEAAQEAISMVIKQGYNTVDALLHTFGDVFGLILLAIGSYITYEGFKKSRSKDSKA